VKTAKISMRITRPNENTGDVKSVFYFFNFHSKLS